ncbi:MAG: hypothetical protein JWP92_482 [Caulobacter sp.]|nr:hypothetical protein [Caulobacter sp.]
MSVSSNVSRRRALGLGLAAAAVAGADATEGGHTAGPNWPYFLDFASRYLDRP